MTDPTQSTLQSYDYPPEIRARVERIDKEIKRRSKLNPQPISITSGCLEAEKRRLIKMWKHDKRTNQA